MRTSDNRRSLFSGGRDVLRHLSESGRGDRSVGIAGRPPKPPDFRASGFGGYVNSSGNSIQLRGAFESAADIHKIRMRGVYGLSEA